jgi:hypothetical protein
MRVTGFQRTADWLSRKQMNEASPTPERFAELIWRTIKLQISLLLAAAVLLLVILAGLTNGTVEATKVDVDFCNRLSSESTKALGKPIIECTTESARRFLEGSRIFSEALRPLNDAYEKEQTVFYEEYDQKRKAAYRLEIGLSAEYGESKIIVNALSVAEVVPFIVTIILAIIVVLGFQRTAYRSHLRELLRTTEPEEISLAIASNQFLSGFDLKKSRKARIGFTIAPDLLAIWRLAAGVCCLHFAVFSAFIGNLVHVTNSIFLNYVCALYSISFILVLAVWLSCIPVRKE